MSRLQSRLTPKATVPGYFPGMNFNNNASVSVREKPVEEKAQQVVGMNLEKKVASVSPSVCVCSRPKQIVLCQKCGATFSGRVAGRCGQHPNHIFLLDIRCCP